MKIVQATFGTPETLPRREEPVVTLQIVLSPAEGEAWGRQSEEHHALADRMIGLITNALSDLGAVITRAMGPRVGRRSP